MRLRDRDQISRVEKVSDAHHVLDCPAPRFAELAVLHGFFFLVQMHLAWSLILSGHHNLKIRSTFAQAGQLIALEATDLHPLVASAYLDFRYQAAVTSDAPGLEGRHRDDQVAVEFLGLCLKPGGDIDIVADRGQQRCPAADPWCRQWRRRREYRCPSARFH